LETLINLFLNRFIGECPRVGLQRLPTLSTLNNIIPRRTSSAFAGVFEGLHSIFLSNPFWQFL
jgi:hypothetical protein